MDRLIDAQIVARAIRDHYGRTLDHVATPTDLAEAFVEIATEAGRIGDATPHPDDWAPSGEDAYDLGGPLANAFGVMRLWRAEEIGWHATRALGRAGRLLPERR